MCPVCGKPYYGSATVPGACAACREKRPSFRESRSLFLHKGTGSRIVHTLKYEGGTWLEAEVSAMLRERPEWKGYFRDALLVPVPLHARRLRKRGYNQAEVIARGIRRVVPGTKMLPMVRRLRKTPSQTFLSRKERRKNMKDAFICDQQVINGQHVMIIDDVMTTGATLDAVADCLAGAGWDPISAFTLAHG